MEYHPRYAQPFTLREATGLDIEVINEEIARLQNSLSKLNDTQAQLREYIDASKEEEPDRDIVEAFQDNIDVIGAQEERISILKMALAEKGIDTSSAHYDIPKPKIEQSLDASSATASPQEDTVEDSNDGGVYL